MSKLVFSCSTLTTAAVLMMAATASAGSLRVVSWNIEDDINGATTPLPGFNTVLQGIGNETTGAGDPAQPLDIMALEETTSNTTTVDPIVAALNSDYAGAKYETTDATSDPNTATRFQATESGGDVADGNGPNSIVWNANTVNLLQVVGVLPSGGTSALGAGSGEYREVVRYEFQPVGGTSPFYIYVAHTKSGSTSSDATARGEEATIIRNNEATLPSTASVMYVGDLNSTPPEAEFTAFTAAGQGQASDPANFSSSVQYYSESATNLRYRDDYQLLSSNVASGGASAINYVGGSFVNLGNNGTTASGASINSPSTTGGKNTALAYMTTSGDSTTQAQVLAAEATASDHLPVIADYTFATAAVPEPASVGGVVIGLLAMRRRRQHAGC